MQRSESHYHSDRSESMQTNLSYKKRIDDMFSFDSIDSNNQKARRSFQDQFQDDCADDLNQFYLMSPCNQKTISLQQSNKNRR